MTVSQKIQSQIFTQIYVCLQKRDCEGLFHSEGKTEGGKVEIEGGEAEIEGGEGKIEGGDGIRGW